MIFSSVEFLALFLPLIIGITFVAWALGRAIERARDGGKNRILIAGVVVILGCLAWFKYANLLVATVDGRCQAPAMSRRHAAGEVSVASGPDKESRGPAHRRRR